MSQLTLHQWITSKNPLRTGESRSAKRRPLRRRYLPHIEALEDRRLLAADPLSASQSPLATGSGSLDGLILVTTKEDVVDLADGLTSLREAIFAANIVSGHNTIQFAETLFVESPATILLTEGELAISDALSILAPAPGC